MWYGSLLLCHWEMFDDRGCLLIQPLLIVYNPFLSDGYGVKSASKMFKYYYHLN